MKAFRYALILVALVGLSNGLNAETKKKTASKQEIAKKHAAAKHAASKHTTSKKSTRAKKDHKIAKSVTAHTVVKKAAVPAQTNTAVKPTESATSKISNWLGLGAATTAATAAAAAGRVVNHRGPSDWHKKHHFPAGWREGFIGKWVGNEWLFAGHTLAWWHENEPTYYKDVVRPEATKAGVPRQHFAHEVATKK